MYTPKTKNKIKTPVRYVKMSEKDMDFVVKEVVKRNNFNVEFIYTQEDSPNDSSVDSDLLL